MNIPVEVVAPIELLSMKSRDHYQRCFSASIKEKTSIKVSFDICKQKAGVRGKYQNQLFKTMAIFWIISSFFLGLPFFLFKRPIFNECLHQYDEQCINKICLSCEESLECLKDKIKFENTLTYKFNLFCSKQSWRVAYKIAPQIFSSVGLIIYGSIADLKGRVVAFKISWRLFTLGMIIFAFTQVQFLITFGYLLASVNCFPSLMAQSILLFQQCSRQSRIRASMLLLASLLIGPLVLSFMIQHILQLIGFRYTLCLLAVPCFILSIFMNKVNQSVRYLYLWNKIMAFNVLNIIAKVNGKDPILVDLGRSNWMKHVQLKFPLLSFFKVPVIKVKLLVGVIMFTTVQLNMRSAQISLDHHTDSYFRSVLMSLSNFCADVTAFYVFLNIKKQIRYFMILTIYLLFSRLLVIRSNDNYINSEITILAIGTRYFNQICYAILLIWTIQSFPTMCRGRCCSLVLSGYCFGSFLAYLLRRNEMVSLVLQLILSLIIIILQIFVNLDVDGRLADTLDQQDYHKTDSFAVY